MSTAKTAHLTAREVVWAEWAIEVMPDFFGELLRDGEIEKLPVLPTVNGDTLTGGDAEAMDDMIERIRDLAMDLVSTEQEDYGVCGKRDRAALRSLLQKIEACR